MDTNHINQPASHLEILIRNLKTEDARNLKIMQSMQKIQWVVVVLYILLLIVFIYLKVSWYKSFGAFILLLAFIGYGLRSGIYKRKMEPIDYGIPTIEMLKKAAYRYRLQTFRGNVIIEITLILLVDIGICLMLYGTIFSFLFIQGFFVFVSAVTFLVGYIIWKKRQKPLRDHALTLLKEIQS